MKIKDHISCNEFTQKSSVSQLYIKLPHYDMKETIDKRNNSKKEEYIWIFDSKQAFTTPNIEKK